MKPFAQAAYGPMGKTATAVSDSGLQAAHPWEGRAIATHKFRLVEYSAYLELRVEESVSFGTGFRLATLFLTNFPLFSHFRSTTSTCLYI